MWKLPVYLNLERADSADVNQCLDVFCPCSVSIVYSASGREDNQLCQAQGNTGVKDTGLFKQRFEDICTTSNHGNRTACLKPALYI